MLQQKSDIFIHLFLTVVWLTALLLVFNNTALASGAAPKSIKDHIQERIEADLINKSFRCKGELICGVSLIPIFYRGRNFAPAWIEGNDILPQAECLITEIKRAYEEGLRPEDYHLHTIVSLLERIDKEMLIEESIDPVTWADLDLLLTDAFMLYSSHLAAGRVNPETIHTDWIIKSPAIDLIDILQSALQSNQISQTIEDLRPNLPGYTGLKQWLLASREMAQKDDGPPLLPGKSLHKRDRGESVRHLHERLVFLGDLQAVATDTEDLFDEAVAVAVQRFQKRHGLTPDGIVGPRTRTALNTPIRQRIRQIELNMERWRWIPRDLGNRYLLVNIAEFKMWVVENHQQILEMSVVVGKPFRRTPVFSSNVTYMEINPFWNIPTLIAVEDILPKVRNDISYLTQQGIKVFNNWDKDASELNPESIDWSNVGPHNFSYRFRQDPGPLNALGQIKFMFPNKFAVYLHDTPKRYLFKQNVRDFSSGCIRIEKPIDLALYLLQDDSRWTREKLLMDIEAGEQKIINLKQPIAIHLQYWTAWVDEAGVLNFRDDLYARDKALDRALKERMRGM